MTRKNRISTLALGASLLGALLAAAPAAAAGSRWPGTKVGEPTPKVQGVPAALARNLANFDDLDFRVYIEEFLFWDNGEFMKQIGLGQ